MNTEIQNTAEVFHKFRECFKQNKGCISEIKESADLVSNITVFALCRSEIRECMIIRHSYGGTKGF